MKNSILLKTLSIFVVSFFILSCGKPKDIATTPGSYNEVTLKKAQAQVCAAGESLKEDEAALDHNFEDLSTFSKVVGFVSDEDCVLEKNYDSSWKEPDAQYMFSVNLGSSRCLRNNSLWTITSTSDSEKYHSMVLRTLDNPSVPDLLIKASKTMNGKFAKSKVGFRLLTCQKTTN